MGALFIYLFIYFKGYLFIFERERERMWGWGRERERQRIPSRLHTVSAESDVGLDPTNCEIMT